MKLLFHEMSILGTQFKKVSLNSSNFEEMKVSWASLENSLVFDGLTYVKLVPNFEILSNLKMQMLLFPVSKVLQAENPWISLHEESPGFRSQKWETYFVALLRVWGKTFIYRRIEYLLDSAFRCHLLVGRFILERIKKLF